MATNKKSSTSKTARVMNLLSKNREEPLEQKVTAAEEQEAPSSAPAAEPAAPEAASPAAAPAPVSHPSTPPIISSMQADSAISDQVLSALESALDDELRAAPGEEPSAAPAEIAAETVSAPIAEETAPEPVAEALNDAVAEAIAQVTEAEEAVVEASEATLIRVPESAESAPAPVESKQETHSLVRSPVDPATSYVNVMESLVEDKAMKYIDLFGLCKCPRCVADVKAFALNHLEPKYVVMRTGDVIPRITLYEGQFAASVTAQLLTACKLVMEHPRHDR